MQKQTLRGYLSFLLIIPLAFLLLLPLLSRPPAPNMSAFYLSQTTMNEQIAFKRTLLISAHQTLLSLKNQTIAPERLNQAAIELSCPLPTTLSSSPFSRLTSIEKQCLSRFEILQVWANIHKDWGSHSNYEAEVRCFGSSSFAACGPLLIYNSQTNTLTLRPNIDVFLKHKNLGGNATGQLPSMEVGG